jgi:hypothetical protein
MFKKNALPLLAATFAALLAAQISTPALAQEEDFLPSLAVDFDYQHQAFDETSAKLYTLALSPALQSGNWMLALDLPLQRVEGEQFVLDGRPRLETFCNNLSSGRELPERLAKRLQEYAGQCAAQGLSETRASGLGDISALASYGRELGTSPWFASFTLGYKADNGDEKEGLGSGTQDLFSEVVLDGKRGKLGSSILLGYNRAIGGAYENLSEDYYYSRLELRMQPSDQWIFGGQWAFQQAAIAEADAVQSLGLFAEFNAGKDWRLRASWDHYLTGDYYPENTIGASANYLF